MSEKNYLIESFTLPCRITVPNRIVKASMTEGLADPATNSSKKRHIELYRLWELQKLAFFLVEILR